LGCGRTSVARLRPDDRMVLVALAVMVADADIQLVAAITVTPTSEPEVFDSVARLVDASLVQARRGDGPHATTCCARSSSMCCKRRTRGGGHRSRTLRRRGPGPRRELATRIVSVDRSATLRLLDREMPHVRAVLGEVCAHG